MPAPNLVIIVKMSGGLIPPNSRAGDVEIYDSGKIVIFESDTDIVERQADRGRIIELLQFSRQIGFFTLPNIIHDSGNSANVPDITISVVDSMGSNTVTMTSYQRLKGEMRKSPFDLLYKKVSDFAWEVYNAPAPVAPAPQAAPQSPAPQVAPQQQPQMPNLQYSAQNNPPSTFELPSLDDLLKNSGLDFDSDQNKSQSLPPLPAQNTTARTQSPTLPPLQQQPSPGASTQGQGFSLPPLQSFTPQQTSSQGASLPPLGGYNTPPRQAPQQSMPQQQQRPPQQQQQKVQQPPPPQQSQMQQQPKQQPPKAASNQQQNSQPPLEQQNSQQNSQPTQQPKQPVQKPNPPAAQSAPVQPTDQMSKQQPVQPKPQVAPQQTAPKPKEQPAVSKQDDRQQPVQSQKQSRPPIDTPNQENQVPRQGEQKRPNEQQLPKQQPPQSMQQDKQAPDNKPSVQQSVPVPMPSRATEDLPQAPRRKEDHLSMKQQEKEVPSVKRPPLSWEQTQDLLHRLEDSVKAKIITFYVTPDHAITMDDMRYLYSHLRKLGRKKSLFVLPIIPQSDITIMWRMATLLREFCQELQIIIPEATSVSTTLLALAADSIYMNPFGYLSPIEAHFSHPLLDREYGSEHVSVPLREILQLTEKPRPAIKTKKIEGADQELQQESLHPLILSAAARQQDLVRMLARNLLSLSKNKYTDEQKSTTVELLLTGYPSQDYPIAFFEAKNLGLPVVETNEDTNDLLWELVRNYLYITHPFVTMHATNMISEEQSVVIESVGRRTVFYKEEQRTQDNKVVDSHNRWREVTMELSMHDNKEQSQLHWKELQLSSVHENLGQPDTHTVITESK